MGNLRCFFRCRFQDTIRKQGKLVELHPYRHTANPAPAKSVLHRPLQCGPPYPPNTEHFVNAWFSAEDRAFPPACPPPRRLTVIALYPVALNNHGSLTGRAGKSTAGPLQDSV